MKSGAALATALLLLTVVSSSLSSQQHPERRLTARDMRERLGQQHLVFGRRAINPNANSLFFGKRSPALRLQSRVDLRHECFNLMLLLGRSDYLELCLGE
ncbi:hypothetical protein ElyMa_003222500 [Elysia marginata]|uniref:Uncharacterized protein n=1 Tax=Elysia marginata TaxID=1093978 RepID=A0AAV4J1W8_9GAST|nr:hypothetical protein ElyMa_003222500 [Elysia marginata]